MLTVSEQIATYHTVAANALAVYFNLKKELGGKIGSQGMQEKEALALLRSLYIYAFVLARDRPENEEEPADSISFLAALEAKIEKYKRSTPDYLDALFFDVVEKMRIANLRPSIAELPYAMIDRQLKKELESSR